MRTAATAVATAAGMSLLPGCGGRMRFHMRRPCRTEFETIAHQMLDVELIHEPGRESFLALDKLIRIAVHFLGDEDLRNPNHEEAMRFFRTVDAVLHFYGFEYQENSLLSRALTARKIDCDGYSSIYLAVGEVLNVPIAMVRAPSHTFVRVQLKNGKYVNWETTVSESKSDAYYIAKHHIDARILGKSALKSLSVDANQEQILSGTFVNCGVEWMRKLKLDKALLYFDQAIKMDAEYDAPYYNKGLVYFHMGDLSSAVTWCERALALNPNHLRSHAVLGLAYKEMDRPMKANSHFRRVRELDPEYYATKVMEMQISRSGDPENTNPI